MLKKESAAIGLVAALVGVIAFAHRDLAGA